MDIYPTNLELPEQSKVRKLRPDGQRDRPRSEKAGEGPPKPRGCGSLRTHKRRKQKALLRARPAAEAAYPGPKHPTAQPMYILQHPLFFFLASSVAQIDHIRAYMLHRIHHMAQKHSRHRRRLLRASSTHVQDVIDGYIDYGGKFAVRQARRTES